MDFKIDIMRQEYDKLVVKAGILNIALQLVEDEMYTKEMAAAELIELLDTIQSV
ncbi:MULTISPECIES: hypothetical protein [Allobacillus]|uniref:hypothetical protein n=1 Tax=Allobacillus TaxID=1400133 RepID=UPI0016425E4A|nr:hypothetical protein [Allobacillus salarius]